MSGFRGGTIRQFLDVYDALPDGVDHRLRPIEDVQLPVDVRCVVAYGLLRDAKSVGYLPVALALGQGPYDLEFSVCERGHQLRPAWPLAALEGAQHLLGELWGDDGVPGVNRADGAREVLELGVLEQITLGAGLYSLEDLFVFFVGRQNDNGGLGQESPDLTRGADTVHLRHGDVPQNHVGLCLPA